MELVNTRMKYAVVNFNQGGGHFGGMGYFFKNIDGLRQGDLVVVDTQRGYQVVRVIGFTSKEPDVIVNKSVIQKVDLEAYEKRMKEQSTLAELELAIESRVEEITKMNRLKQFAEDDESLAKLLKEYSVLRGE